MCRHKLKIILCLRARLSSLRSWKGCNRDNLGQIYGSGCWVNAHDFNKTAPCLPHLPIPGHHRVISGARSANSSTHSLYKDFRQTILCFKTKTRSSGINLTGRGHLVARYVQRSTRSDIEVLFISF